MSEAKLGSGVVVNVQGLGVPTQERPFLVEYFPTAEQFLAEQRVRKDELKFQRDRANAALKKRIKRTPSKKDPRKTESVFECFWRQRDVVGVSVAFRSKLGHIVAPLQICIQVDVVRKKPIEVCRKQRRKIFGDPVTVRYPTSKDPEFPVSVKVREIQYVKSTAVGVKSSSQSGGGYKLEEDHRRNTDC